MHEIKIVIGLNPITKKNSQMIIKGKNGRPFILPSRQYQKYEKDARSYIPSDVRVGIDYPVNVKCLYYMQTRRRVDLTNLLESTDDVLVKHGVLADDNSKIVVAHDGSRVLYDKDKPRTEIYIVPMEDFGK